MNLSKQRSADKLLSHTSHTFDSSKTLFFEVPHLCLITTLSENVFTPIKQCHSLSCDVHEPCTVHMRTAAGLPVGWKQQQTQKSFSLNSALDAGNAECNWWQRSPKIKPPHYHGHCTVMVENNVHCFLFFKTKGSIKLPALRGSARTVARTRCARRVAWDRSEQQRLFGVTQTETTNWMQISRYFF